MEFVDGLNLRHLIRSRQLSPEEALAIVPPLCEALQFAHERNIVHRDIKPENLLLDSTGRIKIADFGIATIIGQTNPAAEQAAGTPAYMAPEQRANAAPVDARADIYSLGVVLYEMLTGERPGSQLTPPSKKATLDVRIDEVVLRALSDQPDQRWQSATALQTELETILSEPANLDFSHTHSTPKRAYFALILSILSILILTLIVLPTKVSQENGSHEFSRKAQLKSEQDDILFQSRPNSRLSNDERARLEKRADEIQSELDALSAPKSAFQRNLPLILTVLVMGLGAFSAITGLTLGWQHLSWLRSQSPEKPALVPGMIAALLWPLIISTVTIFGLLLSSFHSKGWTDQAPYIGLIWAICLAAWIIVRTFAWTKNQPYPLLKNHWFFTIPLIALAIIIPIAHYDHAKKHKAGETKVQKYENSRTRHLEKELGTAFTDHCHFLINGLAPDNPQIKTTFSRINSLEIQLQSFGEEDYLAAKRRSLSTAVTFLESNLASMDIRSVAPDYPDRLRLKEALVYYKAKVADLPSPLPVESPEAPDPSRLLISIFTALIPAIIALIIILKARAYRRAQTA
jgi:serine/threonine protein kinase